MIDTLPIVTLLVLIFLALIWEIGPALIRIAKALESIDNHLAEESNEDTA